MQGVNSADTWRAWEFPVDSAANGVLKSARFRMVRFNSDAEGSHGRFTQQRIGFV